MEVLESALGPRRKLASGGQAIVYRLPDFQIAGVPGPFVYKAYKHTTIAGREAAVRYGLKRLLELPKASPSIQQRFDRGAVWPLAVVTSGDDPSGAAGLVMREIPPRFFAELTLRHSSKRVVRHIGQFLCSQQRLHDVGLPILGKREKLRLLIRTADFVAFLHEQNVIIGDFSGNNVAVCAGPKAGDGWYPMFLDTDGYRLVSQGSPLTQGNTPDWEAPETLAAQRDLVRVSKRGSAQLKEAARAKAETLNVRTDVYKLALLTIRLFHTEDDPTLVRESNSARGSLSAYLGARRWSVIDRALSAEPQERPTASELADALSGSTRSQSPQG